MKSWLHFVVPGWGHVKELNSFQCELFQEAGFEKKKKINFPEM